MMAKLPYKSRIGNNPGLQDPAELVVALGGREQRVVLVAPRNVNRELVINVVDRLFVDRVVFSQQREECGINE